MRLRRRNVLKLLSYSAAGFAASGLSLRSASAKTTVIERDVCVIGGGSGGTYSAVALKDAGKSVVVLERKQRLGGHTECRTQHWWDDRMREDQATTVKIQEEAYHYGPH